ncbi:type II secretion system F family protein [Vibrio sp. S9_S30]|nr:type II secretion system F family protein [Vibrio sp. S9_S30]
MVSAVLIWFDGSKDTHWQRQLERYSEKPKHKKTQVASEYQGWARIGYLYPVSEKESSRLQQLLERAGYFELNAVNKVKAAKFMLGVGVALGVLLWQLQKPEPVSMFTVMFVLVSYVIGSNIPEYWLKRCAGIAKARQQEVLPDAIDLLVISVEAGLSLERSLGKVGHYLVNVEPGLSSQFLRTQAEMKVIGDQSECMKKLAWRSGLEELSRLANTLAMAQKYGSPLADTMRTISEDARQMRKMDLEEKAGSLPGKITLIQMALIMLPLLVLIVAPTLNLLLESLR